MALDTKAYSGHLFRLAIAEQSAFGTRNSTQTAFQELHLTNRPELVSTMVEDSTKRADGSIVSSTRDRYRTVAGGEYTIPIEGILTKASAAYLLYGVCQIITSEDASTPFAKIFTLGDGVTVPDNPNFVFTTLIYDPTTTNNIELQDCVIKNLTLSQSPGTAGGRVTYSGTIYSGHAPDITSVIATPSAPWVSSGTTYYGLSHLDVFTLAAEPLVMHGWSITIDNGAKRFGVDTAGDAQGIAIGAGTAGISVTGELVAKYDANTLGAYASFSAGGATAIAIGFNDTSAEDFSFAMNARYSGEPKKDFGNDAGVAITIPFEALNNIGVTSAFVATLEDAVDRAWT